MVLWGPAGISCRSKQRPFAVFSSVIRYRGYGERISDTVGGIILVNLTARHIHPSKFLHGDSLQCTSSSRNLHLENISQLNRILRYSGARIHCTRVLNEALSVSSLYTSCSSLILGNTYALSGLPFSWKVLSSTSRGDHVYRTDWPTLLLTPRVSTQLYRALLRRVNTSLIVPVLGSLFIDNRFPENSRFCFSKS